MKSLNNDQTHDDVTSDSAGNPAGSASQHDSSVSSTLQASGLDIKLCPSRILQLLSLWIAIIVVVGTAARVVIYQVAPTPDHSIARLMKRFDLGHEPSIPAWYSSLVLLAAACLPATIGGAMSRRQDRSAMHWWALSVLFALLALDEAVMFHEMANNVTRNALHTGGLLYFAWVIPGAAFVMAVGLFFLKFLLQLERRTRRLFVISGCIFVGGALGIELIEGMIVESSGVESLLLTAAQSIEEGCEMFGVALFIHALLEFIAQNVGPIQLNVVVRRE